MPRAAFTGGCTVLPLYCLTGTGMFRAKTAPVNMDSRQATAVADAARPGGDAYTYGTRNFGTLRKPKPPAPTLTLGNIIHFVIAVFFLWPIFLIVAVIASLGDVVALVRATVEASISSTFWCGMWMKECCASPVLHREDPKLLQMRGARRAFGREAMKDWRAAAFALVGIGRSWSKVFGLGGLFMALEERVQRANADWRRYVIQSAPVGAAPADFPKQWAVMDELPRGGSSARLYVVRRRNEQGVVDQTGPLFVLKYFDLTAGGNLENIIRESQAAELAKRLGLIIESSLGNRAFWYVMPYYHGKTLTQTTLDGVKKARSEGARAFAEHQRLALGWVHQVLQIIAQYHEAGVFHKDIKPDNLIVNNEKIYLVDIGLMTPLGSMSQLTTHGTEYFRDPEMVKLALEGKEVREVNASKFDLYSIGAVLFFAIEGEFPTAGALSRFSNDVPLAVQWVANRAMAAMHQRYDNARQMLTDIDYLCWAAANGALDNVKPADLPSFRGMPVPPHLTPAQGIPVVNNTSYRRKLEALPGGYGQWYSAPHFSRKGEFGFRKAAAVLFMVGGLAAIGVVTLGILWEIKKEKERFESQQRQAQADTLASRVDAAKRSRVLIFEQIDRDLADGVSIENIRAAEPLARVDLVPVLVKDFAAASQAWRKELARRLEGQRDKDASAAAAEVLQAPLAFVSIDPDAADAELAAGIEREFLLEAARMRHEQATDVSDQQRLEVRELFQGVKDSSALHRELGARFAKDSANPAQLVVFTIETGTDGTRTLLARLLYPGREARFTYLLR
ncbi:hypothetical protein EDM80_08680 [bacterium]|nr:MAG: hypothetical protein EDM80_08680 [bacterium]